MLVDATQTLTKGFMDDLDTLGNTCQCGDEGFSCCNDDSAFADGCQVNRWTWHSSDETVLTVDEGPNSTTVVTAVGHGTATVECRGYAHWYCDDTCGCNYCSSSSVNSSASCTMWDSSSSCVAWASSTQYYPDGCTPGEPEPEWRDTDTIRVATLTITVYDPEEMEKYVVISGPSCVGLTDTIALTASTLGLTSETYTWSSSNTDVATVASGTVTAVAVGECLIRATGDTSDEYSDFKVKVIGLTDPRVTLWGRSSIGVGESVTFIPSETCEEDTTWTWAVGGGSLVGSDGTYTGGSAGSGSVTVTSVASSVSSSTYTVTVHEYGETFIAITCPGIAEVGSSIELSAEVKTASSTSSVSSSSLGSSSLSSSSGSLSSSSESSSSSSESSAPVYEIIWTTSNSSLATISSAGVLTAIKAGSVTVQAKVNDLGLTETYQIEIVPESAIRQVVYTGPNVLEMSQDEVVTASLLCSCYGSGVTPVYSWDSSNQKVVSVDDSVVIDENTLEPAKQGLAEILVDSTSAVGITQPVVVVPKQDAFVAITHDSVLFDLDPVTFTATTVNGTDSAYTWDTVGDDPCGQFFPLDSTKQFHPTRAGTVVIRATGVDTGATGTATIKIVLRESQYGHEHISRSGVCPAGVVDVEVVDVPSPNTFVEGKSVLGLGEKTTYSVDVTGGDTDSDYVWADSEKLITWQEDYAPADPEYFGLTGYAHATSVGSTNLRVTDRVNEKPVTKRFSVLPVEVMEYKYKITHNHVMLVGGTQTVTIEQGLGLPDETYTLTSDTPAIATVSSLTITAVAEGTATLRVKGNTTGIEETFDVIVKPADQLDVVSIISPKVLFLKPSTVELIDATVYNPDAFFFGYWSSSDSSILALTGGADNTCEMYPSAKGGLVLLTFQDFVDPTIVDSVWVYVVPQETPLLISGQNKLVQTNTCTLTAKTLVNLGPSVTETYTWQSSNEWVATVSSAGVVTAKNAGTCIISAKGATSDQRATWSMKVYPAFVSITGYSNIAEGDSETFVAETYGVTESYDWFSSDHCRATVTSGGVVTAGVRGTAIIMAIGQTTKNKSTWTVTVEFASQVFMHQSTRSSDGSSSFNYSSSLAIPACWMSSSSSDYTSSWATWHSSQSCSSDSDRSFTSCSWTSWSSPSSSSWKETYPYQYSSSSWNSSWSSSGVSSWNQCDVYYVPETIDMQFVSVSGSNKVRLGEAPTFTATGYNEGNEFFPCCGSAESDFYWSASAALTFLNASGTSGATGRFRGMVLGTASIRATRGGHIALHECFTKFSVLRDYIISCASLCTDRSYLCQAYALEVILVCDTKAEAEAKIDSYHTLMTTMHGDSSCSGGA